MSVAGVHVVEFGTNVISCTFHRRTRTCPFVKSDFYAFTTVRRCGRHYVFMSSVCVSVRESVRSSVGHVVEGFEVKRSKVGGVQTRPCASSSNRLVSGALEQLSPADLSHGISLDGSLESIALTTKSRLLLCQNTKKRIVFSLYDFTIYDFCCPLNAVVIFIIGFISGN